MTQDNQQPAAADKLQESAPENAQENAPAFGIEKVYLKDLSVEVPHSPAIFLESRAPQIDIQLNNTGTAISDDLFDSVLSITVTATLEEKTVFLVEVKQAGIFRMRNIPPQELEPLLGIACPNILFPYAREAVSEATARAGFLPVILQPINFEALYFSRQQEQQPQKQETPQ